MLGGYAYNIQIYKGILWLYHPSLPSAWAPTFTSSKLFLSLTLFLVLTLTLPVPLRVSLPLSAENLPSPVTFSTSSTFVLALTSDWSLDFTLFWFRFCYAVFCFPLVLGLSSALLYRLSVACHASILVYQTPSLLVFVTTDVSMSKSFFTWVPEDHFRIYPPCVSEIIDPEDATSPS